VPVPISVTSFSKLILPSPSFALSYALSTGIESYVLKNGPIKVELYDYINNNIFKKNIYLRAYLCCD
jgi:hypothetical protein